MNNKSIKVQVELNRIIGNTYPHRAILKQLDYKWNPYNKWWEKHAPFKNEEREINYKK